MTIVPVPCLEDNYAYLSWMRAPRRPLRLTRWSRRRFSRRPARSAPTSIASSPPTTTGDLLPALPKKSMQLFRYNKDRRSKIVDALKITEKDHAGGNEKMRLQVTGIKVFGGSLDNVKGCTDQVENGTKLSLGKDIEILCLHTPCHTKGPISYYVTSKEKEDPAVFTGDTLFIAGCGRFFEGTAEQMYQSLVVTLGSLPKSTRVYCGHEYTVKNLKFVLTLEPENEKVKQKFEWAQKQREANQPTIPSTIGDEFGRNTFMRVNLPEIQANLVPNLQLKH